MNTTPPPTREERLDRALREIATNNENINTLYDAQMIAIAALQPAADGEETNGKL